MADFHHSRSFRANVSKHNLSCHDVRARSIRYKLRSSSFAGKIALDIEISCPQILANARAVKTLFLSARSISCLTFLIRSGGTRIQMWPSSLAVEITYPMCCCSVAGTSLDLSQFTCSPRALSIAKNSPRISSISCASEHRIKSST